MAIEKPIFIIGSGRSGTTIFYNLLSTHPEVCWFSNFTDRFPHFKSMPLIHRILYLPLIGTHARKNIINSTGRRFNIRPTEAQRIYHEYCGFKHGVKTTEKDLCPEIETKFKVLIERHLVLTGKKRFLNKQTANTQRISLISRMFEDAYYIHIIRDGRAVSNSLFNVRWWNNIDIWWLEQKASAWEKEGRQEIELCGLHWRRDVEEILNNKVLFEDRYIEVRYEDFVVDVKSTMGRIVDFCELRRSKHFFDMLPGTLQNMNYKWKDNLTEEQKVILNKTLKPLLNQLQYE